MQWPSVSFKEGLYHGLRVHSSLRLAFADAAITHHAMVASPGIVFRSGWEPGSSTSWLARDRRIGWGDATRHRHRPLPYPDPAPHAGRKSRAAGRRGGTCTQAPCPLPERPWSIAPDSPPVRPAIPGMATAPPTGSTSGIPSPGSRGPRGVAHFRPRRFPLRMAARPGSISKNPAAYGRVSCLTLRSPFDPWTTSASVCWPAYCCF